MRRIVVGTSRRKGRRAGLIAHGRCHASGRGIASGRSTTAIFDGRRAAGRGVIAGWQIVRAPVTSGVETGMRSSPSDAGTASSGGEEKATARAGNSSGRLIA